MTDKLGSPTTSRGKVVGLGAVLLASYAGLALCGLSAAPWVFLALIVVARLLDVVVERDAAFTAVLRTAQFGVSHRVLLRELAFVVLVTRVSWSSTPLFYAVGGTALAMPLLRTVYLTLLVPLRRRIDAPIEARNVDLTGLRLPRRPPQVLVDRAATRLNQLDTLPLLAGAIAAGTGFVGVYFVVVGAVLALIATGTALLLRELFLLRDCLRGEALLAAVNERVNALRPEVMIYFSGPVDAAYQVNMWLSTADRLSRRTLIVLRERRNLPLLAAADTPVVAIPKSVDFLNFALPDVRVALYPTNVGNNIHMLRVPGVKHVFIGHGDSDKTASFNPFSKVYSEIWVAGQAGRDRYLRANVGVSADDIVEVGRPQLDDIRPAEETPTGPLLTVLYAPTWEGWTNDPYHTSLVLAGPVLVRRLLEARPRVRVIYKPHPLTGTVSRTAARTHLEIEAMLAADNARRAADPQLSVLRADGRDGAFPRAAPPPLPSPPPTQSPSRPEEEKARYAAWSAAWWSAEPAWAHRAVTGAAPTLYDCFNSCDLLVADISSVVSDFLASRKPYVVTNMAGLPDSEFREAYPSAGAAYLLDARAESIVAILELVRGDDPMAARRQAHKTYLLGGDEPDAMTRFDEAVDRAVRTAKHTWPDRAVAAAAAGG